MVLVFLSQYGQDEFYFSLASNFPAYYKKIDLSRYGDPHHFHLIIARKSEQLTTQLVNTRNRILLLGTGLAFIALTFALMASRRLVRPLNDMTSAVEHYENTGKLSKLPINSKDEIGLLARSFQSLILQTQKALLEQKDTNNKLKSIFDSTVDAIITIDSEEKIHTFNNAACDLFGYSRDEVIGENVQLLMPKRYAQTICPASF